MGMSSDSEPLLLIASGDLEAAQRMYSIGGFPERIVGFLVQQAVEKALKSWLLAIGVQPPRTHDIRELLGLLAARTDEASPYWDLSELNVYAVMFRYEDVGFSSPATWPSRLEQAQDLLNRVRDLIETGSA